MMYLAHIAFAIELLVIGAGFVVLHFAADKRSLHLKIVAWVPLIGGAASLGCNLYYSYTYWQQGYFSTPLLNSAPAPVTS